MSNDYFCNCGALSWQKGERNPPACTRCLNCSSGVTQPGSAFPKVKLHSFIKVKRYCKLHGKVDKGVESEICRYCLMTAEDILKFEEIFRSGIERGIRTIRAWAPGSSLFEAPEGGLVQ